MPLLLPAYRTYRNRTLFPPAPVAGHTWPMHRICAIAAIILIAAVHLPGLLSFPLITADEGGWPLSVRLWAETGARTSDYYMAPGYHWLLGSIFRVFGALYSVSRPVSAVVTLLSLVMFYRLAKSVAGSRCAF